MSKLCTRCYAEWGTATRTGPSDLSAVEPAEPCPRCGGALIPTDSLTGQGLVKRRGAAVGNGLIPLTGLVARECASCRKTSYPEWVQMSSAQRLGAWALILGGASLFVVCLVLFQSIVVFWVPIAVGIWMLVRQGAGNLRCPECRHRVGAPVQRVETSKAQRTADKLVWILGIVVGFALIGAIVWAVATGHIIRGGLEPPRPTSGESP